LFASYPIIKKSSKKDVFYKQSEKEEIEIITLESIQTELYNKNIQVVKGDFIE
jgi:hypothetical protein